MRGLLDVVGMLIRNELGKGDELSLRSIRTY